MILSETVIALFLIPVLATYANITVPVIPDPEYLQSLDLPDVDNNDNSALPTDITSILGILGTAGVGYFLKKQQTTSNNRARTLAETAAMLAENDKSTDKGTLDIVYGHHVLVDILCNDPVVKARFDAYETNYGTSATQFFKDLSTNFKQEYDSYYTDSKIVTTTTKDPVINTLKEVQSNITPSSP